MFRCFNILAAPVQMCIQICLRQDVSEEGKKAKTLSSKIEQELSEQAKNETRAVKILMLGAAESGKSTLVKQIKIIYRQGFSKAELLSFKPAVLDNLLKSMKFVLQGMGMLRINLAQKNNKEHAGFILSCNQCLGEDLEVLPFMAHAFFSLWADQGFRATTARGSEFDLNDSALYFFENLSRILAPNYIPTEMDVLKVRVRTCGIIETQFQVNRLVFRCTVSSDAIAIQGSQGRVLRSRMYDLGSQTTERRKWLSCFDKVPIVLFVVALSDYDKTMIEDPAMNRLQESIKLFNSICANGVFSSSSLILFMNKMDLFRDKIQSSGRHLRLYLPSYTGADCDVDTASRHITAMLVASNTTLNKRVFHHFTSATDTSNIRMVFQVAMDTVVKQNLASVSLL